MADVFDGASAGTLRQLAGICRAGQSGPQLTAFAIRKATGCSEVVAAELEALHRDGLSVAHAALLLDARAEAIESRASHVTADLVWTGPETAGSQSRDTAIVVQELFARAERDVLVSTFVIRQAELVFRPLAQRLEAVPALRARIFLHVTRRDRETTLDSELLREFAEDFRRAWPGARLPEVYYDPRGLGATSADRATWHAKCVVVDDDLTFITSANFTEWAHERNVEAGVLLHGRRVASQLRQQFDSLVQSKQVKRVPGL